MEIKETTELLYRITRMDPEPRDTSTEAVVMWHTLIGDLDFNDAIAAVDHHRRTTDEYLQPVHVIRGAARVAARRRQAQAQAELQARSGPAITAGQARLREQAHQYRRAIGAERQQAAIEPRRTGGAPQPPPDLYAGSGLGCTPLREHPRAEARALGLDRLPETPSQPSAVSA